MQRRRFLRLTGLGGVTALAGCSAPDTAEPVRITRDTTRRTTLAPSTDEATQTPHPDTVPESELLRSLPPDAIPAITDPAFGTDWDGIELAAEGPIGPYTSKPVLHPTDEVVGVELAGEPRAYPLRLLDWHEVVNDTFDRPVLVTYCPLCRSAIVAERTIDGRETVFGVSGYLWRNDLVMYDRFTRSLWSQIEARAIRGPRTGTALSLLPSTVTTWGEWQTSHPDTVVLRPPPDSNTVRGRVTGNLDFSAYGDYARTDRVGLTNTTFTDDRLHPKTLVIGVTNDGVTRAYAFPAVQSAGVVEDTVGGLPLVVTATDAGTLVAYDRRVDGHLLTFDRSADGVLRAGGSTWNPVSGRAMDGPYEGTALTPANDRSAMFWFAWLSFHPESTVYGEE